MRQSRKNRGKDTAAEAARAAAAAEAEAEEAAAEEEAAAAEEEAAAAEEEEAAAAAAWVSVLGFALGVLTSRRRLGLGSLRLSWRRLGCGRLSWRWLGCGRLRVDWRWRWERLGLLRLRGRAGRAELGGDGCDGTGSAGGGEALGGCRSRERGLGAMPLPLSVSCRRVGVPGVMTSAPRPVLGVSTP